MTYSDDRQQEKLKAALWEHPLGSQKLLDATEAAMNGGVPMHEIEDILDAKENQDRAKRPRATAVECPECGGEKVTKTEAGWYCLPCARIVDPGRRMDFGKTNPSLRLEREERNRSNGARITQ